MDLTTPATCQQGQGWIVCVDLPECSHQYDEWKRRPQDTGLVDVRIFYFCKNVYINYVG